MPDSFNDPNFTEYTDSYSGRGFALSGKIMLSAIVILFFVVLLMVCLHLYARWYLIRARRRHPRRHHSRNRRANIVFYVDTNHPSVNVTRGLEASVLNSLPVFTYSEKTHPDPLDCAVCLSEFEENESGRLLPKCNHSFHIDCIDMWFLSHSTCPLCRSPVEPCLIQPDNRHEVVLTVNEPDSATVVEPGSGSGSGCESYLTRQMEEEQVGTSSLNCCRSKPTEIEIPRRNTEEFENELNRGLSPASQSFRSPVSRMLSFTRILSRDRRGNTGSCGEPDIERGNNNSKDQTQSNSVATQ